MLFVRQVCYESWNRAEVLRSSITQVLAHERGPRFYNRDAILVSRGVEHNYDGLRLVLQASNG